MICDLRFTIYDLRFTIYDSGERTTKTRKQVRRQNE